MKQKSITQRTPSKKVAPLFDGTKMKERPIPHANAPVSDFELAVCNRIADKLVDSNPEGLNAASLKRLAEWIRAGAP